jgi:hypothetical protein
MSDSSNGSKPQLPGRYSPDCIDIFYDGPTQSKDKPPSPALLELLRATREQLIKHGAIKAAPRVDGAGSAAPANPAADNGPVRVTINPALVTALHGLSRSLELIDENGKVVAMVTPLAEVPCQARQAPCPGDQGEPNQ